MSPDLRPTGALADLVRHLDGRTLRELAATADALHRPRFVDPALAAEELATMATEGRRPSLGWWRRHLESPRPIDLTERQHHMNKAPSPMTTRVGNLTRSPELRYSPKGAPWVTAGLAVDRRERNADGTWEDLPTEYFDVVTFGQLAENAAESLEKGDRVIVVGRLEQETWTGRDGQERTTAKIIADELGPSLRLGTAQVDRTTRTGSDQGGPGRRSRIADATTAKDLFAEVPS